MTVAASDLVIRIFPRPGPEAPYPCEAIVSDGRRYAGQVRLDLGALRRTALDRPAYGRLLFTSLFTDDMATALNAARELAHLRAGPTRLRLWLDRAAPELQALRWERLYDPEEGLFLAATDRGALSRYIGLDLPEATPLTARPIRLLALVANPAGLPTGLAPVNVEREVTELWRSLGDLRQTGRFLQATILPGRTGLSDGLRAGLEADGYQVVDGPATLARLLEYLSDVHILYLVAHGSYFRSMGQENEDRSTLWLEGPEPGLPGPVTDDELVTRLRARAHRPHLVYLSVCDSAPPGPASPPAAGTRSAVAPASAPFVGLGPRLVEAGIPAVVAMQDLLPIEAAAPLAQTFHRALLETGLVDLALNAARLALTGRELPQTVQDAWDVPVLFMRLTTGQLLAPEPVREALKAMAEDPALRRYGGEGRDYWPLPIDVIEEADGQDGNGRATLALRQPSLAGRRAPTANVDLLQTMTRILDGPGHGVAPGAATGTLVVLEGPPGSNKTTQLRRLMWQTVERSLETGQSRPVLPLFLDLSRFPGVRNEAGNPLEALLFRYLQPYWPGLTGPGLSRLMRDPETARLLICIDGGYELSERDLGLAWTHLAELLREPALGRHAFVMALSTTGAAGSAVPAGVKLRRLAIQPLSPRKIRHFLRQRGLDELLYRLEEAELFDLAGIPWFFSWLVDRALAGLFPGSRTQALQRLLGDTLARLEGGPGLAFHAEETLYRLGYEMQRSRRARVSVHEAFKIMADVRGNREYDLEDFYQALLRASLLVEEGEEQVRFAYPAIQAYCWALELAHQPGDKQRQVLNDISATLGRLSRLSWWREALVFLGGLIGEDSPALQSLLQRILYGADLFRDDQAFVAAQCVLENVRHRLALEASAEAMDGRAPGPDPTAVWRDPDPLGPRLVKSLVWRLTGRNESRLEYWLRATALLGQIGFQAPEVAVPHLVALAYKKDRIDANNRQDYHYSNVRLVAAAALQQLLARPGVVSRATEAFIRRELGDEAGGLLAVLREWHDELGMALWSRADQGQGPVQALAVLALGDLLHQWSADPRRADEVGLIIRRLAGLFADDAQEEATIWAVTHALALADTELIGEDVLDPYLDHPERLSPAAGETRQLAQRCKYLAYIIGWVESRRQQDLDFLLHTGLDAWSDRQVWHSVIQALSLLPNKNLKQVLESIAAGERRGNFADQELVPLQESAIQALARVGDLQTLRLLDELVRRAGATTGADLWRAIYQTSEAIRSRVQPPEDW